MKSAILLFALCVACTPRGIFAEPTSDDGAACTACAQPREFWIGEAEAFASAISYYEPNCPIDDWSIPLGSDPNGNAWVVLAQQYLTTLANFNSALTNEAYCKPTIREYLVDDELHVLFARAVEILEGNCGDIPATQSELQQEAIACAGTLESFNDGEWDVSWCLTPSVLEPEVGSFPVDQQFNSGSQAGIIIGVIVGLLLLMLVLFYVNMHWAKARK